MFVIGERINPTGKPDLAKALQAGKKATIQEEALRQEAADADALDVNVSLDGVDRAKAIQFAVEAIREVSGLPLVLDDRDFEVIEAGLEKAGRKAWINSPIDSLAIESRIYAFLEGFRGSIFIVPLKGREVPRTTQDYLETATSILKQLQENGVSHDRVAMDAILFPLKQAKGKVLETLDRIRALREELGVSTVIGLSNLSYSLKNREELNARFLKLATGSNLDYVICDPLQPKVMAVAKAKTEVSIPSGSEEFLEFAESCLS